MRPFILDGICQRSWKGQYRSESWHLGNGEKARPMMIFCSVGYLRSGEEIV